MSHKREYALTAVAGKPRVGKSYLTAQILEAHTIDDGDRTRRGRSVIAILPNMENEYYADYKSIAYDVTEKDEWKRTAPFRVLSENNKNKKVEKRKIIPITKHKRKFSREQMQQACIDVLNHYTNGVVFLEDTVSYIKKNEFKKPAILTALTAFAHKNIDIILHIQHLRMFGEELFQTVSKYRLHKQEGTYDELRGKVGDFALFKIAELMIDYNFYHKNEKRYYLYLDTDKSLLTSSNQKDIVSDFVRASMQYLHTRPNEYNHYMTDFDQKKSTKELRQLAKEKWVKNHLYYIKKQ